jgi:transposase InsO family protein
VPGQTINVDLCLVPASHALERKLPAVSCSSGRLVAERPTAAHTTPSYPGQVFADPDRPYAAAMQAFVAASAAPSAPIAELTTDTPAADAGARPVTTRALRHQARVIQDQRRKVRAVRRQEDAAWRTLRAQRRAQQARSRLAAHRTLPRTRQAQDAQWRALREARRARRAQRNQADAQWRTQRQQLRSQLAPLPLITAWIAILVITDNCTRQCLGLPLFMTGAKVTAAAVVAALRTLLPTELQFLISDRGVHFTAQVFQQLAHDAQFIHVVIARHRPESNGIAERFVRTLKEWLADQVWISEQELACLLEQFRTEYTDRPHQGIAIPGLSPNEFAERIWLF